MSYEYEKYICSPEEVKEWVETFGVAVVKGVLDKNEIKDMRDGMWSYLEHTTQNFEKPIQKHDSKTWVESRSLGMGLAFSTWIPTGLDRLSV